MIVSQKKKKWVSEDCDLEVLEVANLTFNTSNLRHLLSGCLEQTRRTWGECLSPDEWKRRGMLKATCNSHIFKKHSTELHGRVTVDRKTWFKTIPNLNAFLWFHISGFARPWLSLLLDISKSKADKGHRYRSYVLRCVAINLCLPSWTHDLGRAFITADSSSLVSWADSLTVTLPADLQVTKVVDQLPA